MLFFTRYALLLAYGIVLSAAFAGVGPTKKNAVIMGAMFAVSGLAQMAVLLNFGERVVWLAYPLLGHIPLVALLRLHYRKRLVTAVTAVATAYLCCQPVKWLRIAAVVATGMPIAEDVVAIAATLLLGYLLLRYAASSLASAFEKDTFGVLIFGMVPIIYYLFDYGVSVYSDLWGSYSGLVAEFLPAVLSLTFVVFCATYHRTFEQRRESEEREKIARAAVERQAREMEAIRHGEREVRILRHDMRLLLDNVSRCLDENDVESARRLLSGYVEVLEATKVKRWCKSDVVNYVIANCQSRCDARRIHFEASVEVSELSVDELAFSSILSNALDNAINAQEALPDDDRRIKLTLKATEDKLLLMVRNACAAAPVFVDSMPVTKRAGHGLGTQSIRYTTERLGGVCQFSAENGQFLLRVIV